MLLGFNKRFTDLILLGSKVHTLRRNPKRKPKTGETLHMYSGLRTANCKLISKDHKLISKQKLWIRISWHTDGLYGFRLLYMKVCVDGKTIGEYDTAWGLVTDQSLHSFVINDGFENIFDFAHWWIDPFKKQTKNKPGTYKLVKSLNLYHWTDLRY